jgi:2,4-dienoyl-CoA reductase-like NADH-dependent reductase (Old Yellow Enzyme family)
MVRSNKSQSKHDKEVREIANRMKKQGYEVKADISGYGKPDTIGGYRPDVVAKKGSQRKIYEVETPESVDKARDKNQQSAFKNAAKRSKSISFVRKVTD